MRRAPQVDGMFVGEPEDGALQLACLASIDQLSQIRSLTWRRGDAIVPHTAKGSYAGFMDMPYPAWDLVPLAPYSLPLVNRPYVIVETSRGCPYSCDFCVAPIHQGHKFRERSPKALVCHSERSRAAAQARNRTHPGRGAARSGRRRFLASRPEALRSE